MYIEIQGFFKKCRKRQNFSEYIRGIFVSRIYSRSFSETIKVISSIEILEKFAVYGKSPQKFWKNFSEVIQTKKIQKWFVTISALQKTSRSFRRKQKSDFYIRDLRKFCFWIYSWGFSFHERFTNIFWLKRFRSYSWNFHIAKNFLKFSKRTVKSDF